MLAKAVGAMSSYLKCKDLHIIHIDVLGNTPSTFLINVFHIIVHTNKQ